MSAPPESKPIATERLERMVIVLTGQIDEALKALPEDEQRAYRECQQSVTDARRAGERTARELWIG